MKRKSLALMMFSLFVAITAFSSFNSVKNDPVGKWKFSIPDAPYGYEAGIIQVGLEEEKYVASVTFNGLEYIFEGENVIFLDDKLSFNFYVESEDVFVSMKIEKKDEMTGKVAYSGGELVMKASREKE